ncbi:MAG: SIS domain-containing protein [Spirochaetales bacterium]
MKKVNMPRPMAKAKEPSLDTFDDENRKNRVSVTYKELIEQPQNFFKTLTYTEKNSEKFFSDLIDREINKIIFLGCGDSWFVGNSLVYLVEELMQCTCLSIESFEFEKYYHSHIDSHTLVIGQSSGGTTATVLNSLQIALEKGAYTIGMSNTENSKILLEFDFGLLVQAVRKGWPTQATTSAVGAIAYLFATLSVKKNINPIAANMVLDRLKTIPNLMEQVIADNDLKIKNSVHQFVSSVYIQAVGSGPNYAVAQIASAKIKELCPMHSSALPLEEFHHYRTLKDNDTLILICSNGSSLDRETDTALVGAYDGGKIITVGAHIPDEIGAVSDLICEIPYIEEGLMPLIASLPVHLFAYHLAIEKFNQKVGYPEVY